MKVAGMLNSGTRRGTRLDWIVGLTLLAASAAVVVWQNSRLGVLWDLSYVLENSFRISLGNVPYRDFPFPYPPLTFLIQAAIIKLTGRVFWHHIAYCAALGGLATVLTWRILLNMLRETVAHAWWLALLLSLPLIPLGIYCIFPHPFYDPDSTIAILVGVLLLQQLKPRPISWVVAFLTGLTLVIPLFVKQNVGLAFLLSAAGGLAALTASEAFRRRPVRQYALTLGGAIAALAFALFMIHLTAGLKNYWFWTIRFAAARRTPARGEMLGIYRDKILLLWLAIFAVGAIAFRFSQQRGRVLALLSGLLMSVPFAWPAIYLLRNQDASERAERLLMVWPVLLVLSFVIALVTIKRRTGVSIVLPLILIGAIHGAFMSQQLWGSTYAIWPLFMILLASTIARLWRRQALSSSWMTIPFTAITVLSLLISGGSYLWSHERLDYANLDDGDMQRSNLPQLKGLSVRGPWVPDFEELIRYCEGEIPRDDALLVMPGEDPFYYTTGRRPQFPVTLFDPTTNPYSPEQIVQLCRDRNVRWVIVKQDLQLEDKQVPAEMDHLTELLEDDFEQIETLNNYEIYRRNHAEDESDSEDQSDSDGSHDPNR